MVKVLLLRVYLKKDVNHVHKFKVAIAYNTNSMLITI